MRTQYQEPLLNAFRRAAQMPWYQTLLDECGVGPAQVVDAASFSILCPVLTKQNTFDRFPMDQLAGSTHVSDVATVLTSSGHGGRFSYGLTTRSQAAKSGGFIDQAFDSAFGVKSQSTLAINCLPMGVGFSSECMTVATVSVREDMAVALVKAFGSQYGQILLVSDPLFIKKLAEYAAEQDVDWTRYRVQVVLGEEIFGEHFRDYIATSLGLDMGLPNHGQIISSFGVGELGLHLGYETAATLALRRAAWKNPDLALDMLGVDHAGKALPMVLAFNPSRTFMEIVEPDSSGFGRLTVSMLDTELPVPLLRYQTGDVARLLDPKSVAGILRRHGAAVAADLPSGLIALQGRGKEALPNGSHVGVYKDALYADHAVAKELSGAFRVIANGNRCVMHVQLSPSRAATDSIEQRLLQAIPEPARPETIVLWAYHKFPFGMSVDYERKFPYYVAGEQSLPAAAEGPQS